MLIDNMCVMSNHKLNAYNARAELCVHCFMSMYVSCRDIHVYFNCTCLKLTSSNLFIKNHDSLCG